MSEREIEHNGEDIITIKNMFKREACLQFTKRDYGKKNVRLNHLHTPVPTSKDYTVSATLSEKHILDYTV